MALYVVLFILAVLPLEGQEDVPAFFETRVRPLLAAQCLECDSATRQPIMAGRLDSLETALKGGGRGPAIMPGKPAESLRIFVALVGPATSMAGPLDAALAMVSVRHPSAVAVFVLPNHSQWK